MKQNPLAGLHDIHLPEPVSCWPPAPGWWILAVLTLLVAAAVIWWLRRRKAEQKRPKQFSQRDMIDQAVDELGQLDQRVSDGADARILAADLSALLRRVAMRLDARQPDQHERTDIAGMRGDDWLAWLDGQWENDAFSQGAGRQLLDAPYRRDGQVDIRVLVEISREWLEAQR